MRVLVILGHPRKDSFCAALVQTFCSTLASHHIEYRELILADLAFDLHVRHASIHDQPLEPDLEAAREAITWADHLVFVHPVGRGTMPALQKGFLDRVLLPGFAFRERESGPGFEGLLRGKSAQVLTTMDTPPWVVRWILRSPGHRAFDVTTLGFCGIQPVRNRMSREITLEVLSRPALLWVSSYSAGDEPPEARADQQGRHGVTQRSSRQAALRTDGGSWACAF